MLRVERFREWQKLRAVSSEHEEPEVLAGRNAEHFLLRMVRSNHFLKSASCFHSKRVPCPKLHRRFEIDVIVVTHKRLHLIEVKNWSGELFRQGDEFIQHRRNGNLESHGRLLDLQISKEEALYEHLRANGCDLPRNFLASRILFMNRNLTIARDVQSERTIITPSQLHTYLASQKTASYGERFLHALMEICLKLDNEETQIVTQQLFDSIPEKDYKKITSIIGDLRTFDRLVLYGGKTIPGDAISLSVGERKIDLKQMLPESTITFNWPRSLINGFFRVMFWEEAIGQMTSSEYKIPIAADDQLLFHRVGEISPANIRLSELESLIIG